MLQIDAEHTRRALRFTAVIDALRDAFRGGAHVPPRHVHAIESGGAQGTTLIMPAWTTPAISASRSSISFPPTPTRGCPACMRPTRCTAPVPGCRWRRSTATS
ncbi:ornithine cyclodeaminase domain protein [Bordetella bronchiseptica MBORD675]|nr:ornithine cyclodeaminase domain protein [Bordetella bronchiseptica MBORD675]